MEVMEFPTELFQILKDDDVKVLHSICQHIWKTQQWPQDWKWSVFIPSQRKAMPENVQTTAQLHLSHTLAKYYSKFSKQSINSTSTENFQMYKLAFEKIDEPYIKLPTTVGYRKSKRVPEKHLLLLR